MNKQIPFKNLINVLQLLHQMELTDYSTGSHAETTPMVGDWEFQGNVQHGWTVTIPVDDVAPHAKPILRLLGFEETDDGFFVLIVGPGESVWSLVGDNHGPEEELIPDKLLRRWHADAEMADILLGRMVGALPPDLLGDGAC